MFKYFAPALAAAFLFSIPASAVTYPALPTATVDVTCCPAVTRTVAVHTAIQLQAALDNATLGDEIVLDAGTTYKGNFLLKIPAGTSGWVTVRSSASASLPSPGTRVSLSDAPKMAKIMSPNFGDAGAVTSNPAIGNHYNSTTYTDMGIHHYRFIGIEFATGLTSYNYHVIYIAPPALGVPFSPATMPHDIIIDRCLIHGNDPIGTTFPDGTSQLNGSALFDVTNGAVVDSKIYNLWGVGIETQALSCRGGPGPMLIQNNEISGGTESFMCGGGLLPYSDRIPTDITVVHNYFNHPAAWHTGTPVVYVKNLFELKVSKRVRVTDNVFDGSWDLGGGQNGTALTITPRPVQDSGEGFQPSIYLTNEVSDTLVAHNVARNVGEFVSTGLYDYYCLIRAVTCVQSARLMISDNMADYNTSFTYNTPPGLSASSMQDFSVKRNTLLGHGSTPGKALWANRGTCSATFGTNFEWSFNINLNGTQGDCTYDPANILVASWLGTVSVTSNLVANVTAGELTAWNTFGHASLVASTESSIKLNADELTLQASSPYFGMGIGADLSCLNEAAIRAGTPSALCPLPPEVQGGAAAPQGQVSCDLNNDGQVNVLDVQLATNQALGTMACSTAALSGNGQCTIVDVMRIVSASLGATCNTGP